jgi:hypothetical protein
MAAISDDRGALRMRVEVIDEGLHVSGRHAQVGIHEKDDFPGSAQHAGADGKPFPPVHRIFDNGDTRIALRRGAGGLRCAVGGGFDHDDHFGDSRKIGGEAAQSGHRAADPMLLCIGRDDN